MGRSRWRRYGSALATFTRPGFATRTAGLTRRLWSKIGFGWFRVIGDRRRRRAFASANNAVDDAPTFAYVVFQTRHFHHDFREILKQPPPLNAFRAACRRVWG